jgi:hypothetical protein
MFLRPVVVEVMVTAEPLESSLQPEDVVSNKAWELDPPTRMFFKYADANKRLLSNEFNFAGLVLLGELRECRGW